MFARLKRWAARIKVELRALWRAFGDPRTPRLAKAVIIMVVAYAISPIDLIPDFIPVIGLLDDAILLPLGIMLAVRLIPSDVMAQARGDEGGAHTQSVWMGRVAAVSIVAVWAAILVVVLLALTRGAVGGATG
jgi:uncharacterized membrane protein YkvA (DUF1232 family)